MLISLKEQTEWLTILAKEPGTEEEHETQQTTERKQEGNSHTEGPSLIAVHLLLGLSQASAGQGDTVAALLPPLYLWSTQ